MAMRQSSGLAWGLCALLCLCNLREAITIANIDVTQPIVRRSPVQFSDDDFFGYTIVLHQREIPSTFEEALEQTRIIVGAPRGTYPGGLSLPENGMAENQTGLIYDCPIQLGDCNGLFGSGSGNDLRLFDPEADETDGAGGPPIEQKSEQFLGGTMYSNGDFFLACASRWASNLPMSPNEDNRRTFGRCFISNRSLSNFQLVQPCQSESLSISRDGATHCSAGVGAVLYEDVIGPGLALGAPGFESAIGQLFYYRLQPNASLIEPRLQTVANFGSLGIQYSYLGYTVTTGRIRSPDKLDILASRPRHDGRTYMGQVQLFSLDDVTDLRLQTVTGSQTGEYFGFSLATADLNGDGFEELLVGAPMYSIPGKPKLSCSVVPEIGRVYVFENLNGTLSDTPIVLQGNEVAHSRFGHSVISIGDVNDDGYEDVAVGAPFMVDLVHPNANGTVFIYYGSGDEVITASLQQVIRASDVVSAVEELVELKTFGYSLASGVDVDANEYYDLAVGSFASQAVIVFRAHSVARLVVDSTALVDIVDVVIRSCNNSIFSCFNISVCASYSGRGLDGELQLNLQVTERRNVTLTNEQRLVFGSDPDEQYNQPFVFANSGVVTCEVLTIYVKSTDIRELIPFTLDVTFSSPPRESETIDGNQILSDLTLTPMLLVTGNTTVEVNIAPLAIRSSGVNSEALSNDRDAQPQNQLDGCAQQTGSCSLCIQYSPDCVWCPSPPENMQVRCQNRTLGVTCGSDLLVQDPTSSVTITRNEDSDLFQVKPQSLNITARTGDTQYFNVTVRRINNFALDLYILMDFSASLDNNLAVLREISHNITSTLENLTSDFQIGFGSFVDKRTLPFTLRSFARIFRDGFRFCLTGRSSCVPTYSYLHQLNLTTNTTAFQQVLNEAELSANVDTPEGGLDALAQAAVCGDIIGWRNSAVHMLLYLSDADFHFAGDGKLGGVVRPNDGKCHIKQREDSTFFEYTLDTVFDYPSLYHLNSLLIENQIMPVFVNSNPYFIESYQTLEELLDSAQSVFIDETEQILTVIREAYNNLTFIVKPVPALSYSDDVTIKVEPACDHPTSNGGCAVAPGQEVTFRISVTLNGCGVEHREPMRLPIRVPGFGTTNVLLHSVCDCDCEENPETNSEACSGSGTLVCGLCECIEEWSGSRCQCPLTPEACPLFNGIPCVGNGICDECNQCVCFDAFFGPDCSCSPASCPQFNNVNCGGPQRGVCDCPTISCMCLIAQPSGFPYFGDGCQCDPNNCYNEAFPGELCHVLGDGVSTCSCNLCLCPPGFFQDNGTCRPGVCEANQPCARCIAGFSSGTEIGCANLEGCNGILITPTASVDSTYIECTFIDDDGRLHIFHVPPNQDEFPNLPIFVEGIQEIPLQIAFVNNSPRVIGSNIFVNISVNKPTSSLVCSLRDPRQEFFAEQDCSILNIVYPNLNVGYYILRVVARTDTGELAKIRRGIRVGNNIDCTVNLINGGIEVQDGEVSIQFVVNGDATSQRHLCQVDREPRRQCLSETPVLLSGLSRGGHRFRVLPQGCIGQSHGLIVRITVP